VTLGRGTGEAHQPSPSRGLGRSLLARWYLTAAGLVVTIALCAGVATLVHPQYDAKSVVVLLPPPVPTATNPYLNLGSLSGLPDVINQSLAAPDTVELVKERGYLGTYSVTSDLTTGGPLLRVTANAKTPKEAVDLANYITSLIPPTLVRLQNAIGVDSAKSYITSLVINPVGKAAAVRKTQIRAVLVAAAVGLMLTVLLVAAAERLSHRARHPRPASATLGMPRRWRPRIGRRVSREADPGFAARDRSRGPKPGPRSVTDRLPGARPKVAGSSDPRVPGKI
jgi:hypothetical protein